MFVPIRFGLLSLLLASVPAAALNYQASLDGADWKVERASQSCRLRQSIPHFGAAVIETSGGGERFFLQLAADRPLPMMPGSAQLAAAAPFWNPGREARPLGSVAVAAGDRLVDIEGDQVGQLLRGLKEGLAAAVIGRTRDGAAEVQVVALPVHFERAWREYDACVQKLPPAPRPLVAVRPAAAVATVAAASPVRTDAGSGGVKLDYAPGEWQLQPSQRAALQGVLQLLLADSSLRVSVDGYGNDSYRRLLNLELSRKRAQAVGDLLTAGGVDAGRIALRFHGDEKSSARRVVVKVE